MTIPVIDSPDPPAEEPVLHPAEEPVPPPAEDPNPLPSEAEALLDEEWLAEREDQGEEEEAVLTAKELAEAKEEYARWIEVVTGDREVWKKASERDYVPQVSMVEWTFVEPVVSKNKTDVLTDVGRMYARAISEGFSVRRLHSDRGKEYHNTALKAWCAKMGVHKTLALAEEHQSNGRAEGGILRVKSKTRAILQQQGSNKKEWPLAARLAAHSLQAAARKKLGMPRVPTLPCNSQVQVIQRSWNRDVWESVTVPASTKCPSGDTSRGWVVQLPDSRLLTTAKCFPAPSDEQNLEVKVSGEPLGAAVPTHRLREKVTLRKLAEWLPEEDNLSAVDRFAKELWSEGSFLPKHLAALAVKLGPKGGGSQSFEFLTGAYAHGGVTGIRNNTHDHGFRDTWPTTSASTYPITSQP